MARLGDASEDHREVLGTDGGVSCDRKYPYLIHQSAIIVLLTLLHDIFILISEVRPMKSMVPSSTPPSTVWSRARILVQTPWQVKRAPRSAPLGLVWSNFTSSFLTSHHTLALYGSSRLIFQYGDAIPVINIDFHLLQFCESWLDKTCNPKVSRFQMFP